MICPDCNGEKKIAMNKSDNPSSCPECGKVLDCSTSVEFDGAKPSPGDISICLDCTAILEFGENLELKRISNEDFSSLPENIKNSLKKVRDAINSLNIERNRF